jgi:hypothetical protein
MLNCTHDELLESSATELSRLRAQMAACVEEHSANLRQLRTDIFYEQLDTFDPDPRRLIVTDSASHTPPHPNYARLSIGVRVVFINSSSCISHGPFPDVTSSELHFLNQPRLLQRLQCAAARMPMPDTFVMPTDNEIEDVMYPFLDLHAAKLVQRPEARIIEEIPSMHSEMHIYELRFTLFVWFSLPVTSSLLPMPAPQLVSIDRLNLAEGDGFFIDV